MKYYIFFILKLFIIYKISGQIEVKYGPWININFNIDQIKSISSFIESDTLILSRNKIYSADGKYYLEIVDTNERRSGKIFLKSNENMLIENIEIPKNPTYYWGNGFLLIMNSLNYQKHVVLHINYKTKEVKRIYLPVLKYLGSDNNKTFYFTENFMTNKANEHIYTFNLAGFQKNNDKYKKKIKEQLNQKNYSIKEKKKLLKRIKSIVKRKEKSNNKYPNYIFYTKKLKLFSLSCYMCPYHISIYQSLDTILYYNYVQSYFDAELVFNNNDYYIMVVPIEGYDIGFPREVFLIDGDSIILLFSVLNENFFSPNRYIEEVKVIDNLLFIKTTMKIDDKKKNSILIFDLKKREFKKVNMIIFE